MSIRLNLKKTTLIACIGVIGFGIIGEEVTRF